MPTKHEIRMSSGTYIDPTKVRVDNININDIARGLANECRYAGQVSPFYSVAQHSVLVSRNVSPGNELKGLLHDSAEGLGFKDMPRPLKTNWGMWWYRRQEDKLLNKVFKRFDLEPGIPENIHKIDVQVFHAERYRLFGYDRPEDVTVGINCPGDPCTVCGPWEAWTPSRAEFEFKLRFAELTKDKQIDPAWGIAPDPKWNVSMTNNRPYNETIQAVRAKPYNYPGEMFIPVSLDFPDRPLFDNKVRTFDGREV